jgi:DivIVA domain-containing protein
VVALLVAVVVALVVLGLGWALLRPAGALLTAPPDAADVGLPHDREVSGADVDAVGLGLAFRGYRMDEVDAVLDRLRDALQARDAEISRLEAMLVAGTGTDRPGEAGTAGGGAWPSSR